MSLGFGVGDFLAVTELILRVHNSCKNAPEQFSQLRSQTDSLSDALQRVQGSLPSSARSTSGDAELLNIVEGFKPLLKELNSLLAKRKRLETRGLHLWDRLRWPGDAKIQSIRSQLSSQLALLAFRVQLLTWYLHSTVSTFWKACG